MSSTKRHFQGKGGVYKGSDTITIAAITPEDIADYDIADANAAIGDVISVSLAEPNMEDNLCVVGSWVAADGTISVRIANIAAAGGSNLTGGAATVYYSILK